MNTTTLMDIPEDIQEKLDAYDKIRASQRKHSKAHMAKISNTDEYRKKQRDYYHAIQEAKQEQGRKNWSSYYQNTGKQQKQEY